MPLLHSYIICNYTTIQLTLETDSTVVIGVLMHWKCKIRRTKGVRQMNAKDTAIQM